QIQPRMTSITRTYLAAGFLLIPQCLHRLELRRCGRRIEGCKEADDDRRSRNDDGVEGRRFKRNVRNRVNVGRETDEMIFVGEVTRDLADRSEEHTSELQSRFDLVCRLLLEKKK